MGGSRGLIYARTVSGRVTWFAGSARFTLKLAPVVGVQPKKRVILVVVVTEGSLKMRARMRPSGSVTAPALLRTGMFTVEPGALPFTRGATMLVTEGGGAQ